MQIHPYGLIAFGLCVAVASSVTVINTFGAQVDIGEFGMHETIFATHIELWVDVSGCPTPVCECEVKTNASNSDVYTVTFPKDKPKLGTVKIEYLQPDTLYWFTATCKDTGVAIGKTIELRTDSGRPSAPREIKVSLPSKRVQITWDPPQVPAGPINNYRLMVDNEIVPVNIESTLRSYTMPEDYVYGIGHTFALMACNKNKQNNLVCSNRNDGTVTFFQPTTTSTSTAETTTTAPVVTTSPKSHGTHSYSVSISVVTFCILLFTSMRQ